MSRSYDLINAANRWIQAGVSVVPVEPRSKACLVRWRLFESRLPTDSELRTWFRGGAVNLAVVCGTGGLLVLDFDDLSKYSWFVFQSNHLANTYTEFTHRGAHLFYQVDQPITARFTECESLGLGHLCMVSPSVHPEGTIYRPALNPCHAILKANTVDLFSLLSKQESKTVKAVVGINDSYPEGGEVFNKKPVSNSKVSLVIKIKSSVDLFSYVQSLTELKPSGGDGRWWMGRCPLHDDKSPSLWVDRARGVWGCHSPSCPGHRTGDVINFYALVNHLSIGDAIQALARMANL